LRATERSVAISCSVMRLLRRFALRKDTELLNGNALGKVARLIHIATSEGSNVVS